MTRLPGHLGTTKPALQPKPLSPHQEEQVGRTALQQRKRQGVKIYFRLVQLPFYYDVQYQILLQFSKHSSLHQDTETQKSHSSSPAIFSLLPTHFNMPHSRQCLHLFWCFILYLLLVLCCGMNHFLYNHTILQLADHSPCDVRFLALHQISVQSGRMSSYVTVS